MMNPPALLGIAIATFAAFLWSSVYYSVTPAVPTATGAPPDPAARPTPAQIAVELVRCLLVALLLAGLLVAAGWQGAVPGVLLGLTLWVLPLVLLAGSVLWERVPVRTAALHAGDWLAKLVLVGATVGLFL